MEKTCEEKLKVIQRRMKVLDDTVKMLLGVDRAKQERIETLEKVVYELERRKSNGVHPNDGGWND